VPGQLAIVRRTGMTSGRRAFDDAIRTGPLFSRLARDPPDPPKQAWAPNGWPRILGREGGDGHTGRRSSIWLVAEAHADQVLGSWQGERNPSLSALKRAPSPTVLRPEGPGRASRMPKPNGSEGRRCGLSKDRRGADPHGRWAPRCSPIAAIASSDVLMAGHFAECREGWLALE